MPTSHRSAPLSLAELVAAAASPPPGFVYPRRVDLTLADADRVERLTAAVPDAQGRPFLSLRDAVALALDVAANVARAGDLDRYRTPPPPPLPVPELSAATLAWLEGFRADVEARATAAAEAAKRRDRSGGRRRR